jgi:hypothetical protein
MPVGGLYRRDEALVQSGPGADLGESAACFLSYATLNPFLGRYTAPGNIGQDGFSPSYPVDRASSTRRDRSPPTPGTGRDNPDCVPVGGRDPLAAYFGGVLFS